MYKVLISWLLFPIMFVTTQVSAAQFTDCMREQCQSYFKKYKKLTHLNNYDATLTLAAMYHHGYGTEKNLRKALNYFELVANAGSPHAAYSAGIIYLTDNALYNTKKGLAYLNKAAKEDHQEATLALALIYINGEHGTHDLSQADKWLAKAYQLKHLDMAEVITQIDQKTSYKREDFPLLYQALSIDNYDVKNSSLVKNDQSRPELSENKELTDFFDKQLRALQVAETGRIAYRYTTKNKALDEFDGIQKTISAGAQMRLRQGIKSSYGFKRKNSFQLHKK